MRLSNASRPSGARTARRLVRGGSLAAAALALAAACAEPDFGEEEQTPLPGRTDGGGVDGQATDEGGVTTDGGGGGDAGVRAEGGDAGRQRCDVKDGLDVFCVARGASFTTYGTITYGPGFPAGLPAMGLGKIAVGYLPADYPMTCLATPGARGLSPPNNTGGGKICEVAFDNTNTASATGTATYVVSIAADAAFGDYSVGLVASAGSTIAEPSFYLRVTQ